MKKIMPILVLGLAIFSVFSMISIFSNNDVITDLEKVVLNLNKDIEMKDDTISDLQNKIDIQDQDFLVVSDKLRANELILQETIEANQHLIEDKEQMIQENNTSLESSNSANIGLDNYSLEYDNVNFNFELSEKKVIESFGKPKTETIDIYDAHGFWYLEGIYSKESIYDDFVIRYHGDKIGENYKMIGLSTTSNKLILDGKFKVGDSVDILLEEYPWLIEDAWSNEGQGYLYQDMVDMASVYFKIDDCKISEINIGVVFD